MVVVVDSVIGFVGIWSVGNRGNHRTTVAQRTIGTLHVKRTSWTFSSYKFQQLAHLVVPENPGKPLVLFSTIGLQNHRNSADITTLSMATGTAREAYCPTSTSSHDPLVIQVQQCWETIPKGPGSR